MEQTNKTSKEILQLFETYLKDEGFEGFPEVLAAPALYIMQVKGKRVRPLLLLTSCQVFGGDLQLALGPACALELFHNFSLVHDDIIDEAELRRGKPSVHFVYGTNKALLTGDALLLHSVKLLANGSSKPLSELLQVFLKASSEVIEGEQYDVDFETMNEVTEQEYMMMIEYKTSVLLAAALQMGAILGDASPEDQKHMYDFGLNLGLSFQIKDDYLDAYGDGETFGKKIGGDIIQNKKTYLLVKALEKATREERNTIFNLFDDINEEKKVAAMMTLYDSLGVREKTYQKMEELYQLAISSLDDVSLDRQTKKPLYELAEMVYLRNH